jgi:hypothetical protein
MPSAVRYQQVVIKRVERGSRKPLLQSLDGEKERVTACD